MDVEDSSQQMETAMKANGKQMNLKEREPTRLTIPNKSLQDYGSMAI
jgi:hypothetical protein